MPLTRFGIYRPKHDEWWCGGNKWTRSAASARWYDSMTDANLKALRELPDPRDTWIVKPIPESAY